MGLYDPSFQRKPFKPHTRDGEVPGSIVIGKSGNKGCIWPGQGGKWFASTPGHTVDQPYPSFDGRDAALEFILAPLREQHEERETERENAWIRAAPKREARAERTREREARRLERKRKKGEKVWRVLNADGLEIGRVARVLKADALVAAASLLGFCILPVGYDVVAVD